MREVSARAGGQPIVPGLDDPDAFGADAPAPTLVVDAGPLAARKLAAIQCHRSQFAASAFAVPHRRRRRPHRRRTLPSRADRRRRADLPRSTRHARRPARSLSPSCTPPCSPCSAVPSAAPRRSRSWPSRPRGATQTASTSAVLGCGCCAYPVVAGIPVLIAGDRERAAITAIEAGRHDDALEIMLELDEQRRPALRALVRYHGAMATYREAIDVLSPDAEGTLLPLSSLRSHVRHRVRRAARAGRDADDDWRAGRSTSVAARVTSRACSPVSAAAPARPSLPTSTSGSCGSRRASPFQACTRCAATPTTRCPSTAASRRS